MRNRQQTEDTRGVLFAVSCIKIFHQQDILQMHLHISPYDSPIGVPPVVNPIRPKPSDLIAY